jgi:Sec-independent protein translocase protein TatA
MFGLTPIQILIVVVIGFLVFGVGGSKKLFRRGANRVKDTGGGIKGAATELQASLGEEADENSAIYRATVAGREKATEGATIALEAAKEARDEVAGLAEDARAGATGAEPQTAIGRAARSVSDTARDVRAGITSDEDAEHEPQTALGKAAKSVGDSAKARVDMLGDTASEFAAGIEGAPAAEATPSATEPAALPAADDSPPAAPPTQT